MDVWKFLLIEDISDDSREKNRDSPTMSPIESITILAIVDTMHNFAASLSRYLLLRFIEVSNQSCFVNITKGIDMTDRGGDMLYYYSGSADKIPGSGTNESVSVKGSYSRLRQFPNWRRTLSNFYVGVFSYGGMRYNTAEHAFQGMKISMGDRERALLFSLDSGSELSKGDGNSARSMRKMVTLNSDQLTKWNSTKGQVMREILSAKFTQIPHAGHVLLATHDAQLWHGAPRTPKERQYALEDVRTRLRTNPDVLAYVLSQGDTDTLTGLLSRQNVISVLARTDVRTLPTAVVTWMSLQGLHPEWFTSLYIQSEPMDGMPNNLWSMMLANAISIGNVPLIQDILHTHSDKMTSTMVDNARKLTSDDRVLSLLPTTSS